jgi:hypothetical protein
MKIRIMRFRRWIAVLLVPVVWPCVSQEKFADYFWDVYDKVNLF